MLIIDLFYLLLLLLGSPYFLYRFIVRRRWPHHYREKMAKRLEHRGECDVLVHCVSVGEANAAVSIVEELRAKGKKVIVSVTTRTGMEIAQKRYGTDSVVYYPYDFSGAVRRFLNAVKPKVVVLVELEIWPNFVRSCAKRGIPIAVINGRMTEKSLSGYKLLRPLLHSLWQAITWFGVQDEIQKERFIRAGAPAGRVEVAGSVKFDKTPPKGWREAKAEVGFPDGSLVVVAGSTHRGEDEIVLDAWEKVHREIPSAKLLLCPRHLERLGEVEKLLDALPCKWSRKTEERSTDIVLLDTMGELSRLYGAADVVIVGGTLVEGIGGHDPIEPLLLQKPVIIGPYYEGIRDIVGKLLEDKSIITVSPEKDLPSTLMELASDRDARVQAGKRALQSLRKHSGARKKYVEAILNLDRERKQNAR